MRTKLKASLLKQVLEGKVNLEPREAGDAMSDNENARDPAEHLSAELRSKGMDRYADIVDALIDENWELRTVIVEQMTAALKRATRCGACEMEAINHPLCGGATHTCGKTQ